MDKINGMHQGLLREYISLEVLSLRIGLPQKYLKSLIISSQIPFLDTGNGRLRFREGNVLIALDKIAQIHS